MSAVSGSSVGGSDGFAGTSGSPFPEEVLKGAHVLVLGAGHVGSAVAERARGAGARVTVTHRAPGKSVPPGCDVAVFDASAESTWGSLPADATHVAWTFASDSAALPLFRWLSGRLSPAAAVAVYSTTACYRVAAPDAEVDESAALALEEVRFASEEGMRLEGAGVLALSGLFGRGRDPARWVERGLVRNGDSLVNLVHADDVARATIEWFLRPARGERINVSTQCHRWHDLVAAFEASGRVPAGTRLPAGGPSVSSKRVSGAKLARLYPRFAETPPFDARGGFP